MDTSARGIPVVTTSGSAAMGQGDRGWPSGTPSRRTWCALTVGLALLLATVSGVSAAGPERVLSGDFHRGLALALDDAGHRHLVATSAEGHLWYATDRTGVWTRKRILRGEPGSFVWTNPTIATDDHGRIHVAAVRDHVFDTPGSTGGIYYKTDKGRPRGAFGPKVRIAPPMMTTPSLRVVDDVRYLAYARCACEPGREKVPVFFKTDRGGTWHVERVADRGFFPSMRVDRRGRARIAFSDRMRLRYTVARTRFGDFSPSVRIPGTVSVPGTPSLALDAAGRAHIAWATWAVEPKALYVRKGASGWSTPRHLGRGHATRLSIDALGRPHIVVAGQKLVHRWLAKGDWKRHTIRSEDGISSVDIRAFGTRASIAWAQDVPPRGVWLTRH